MPTNRSRLEFIARTSRSRVVAACVGAAAGLFVLGGSPAVALPPLLPPAPEPVKQPVMVFPEGVTHEFGEIWDHEHVEHEFVFENGGDEPFEITGLRSTCGCTISAVRNQAGETLPEGQRVFQPGERGVIVADFNPAARIGRQIKPIYVTLNDAPRPQYTLRISSQVTQVVITEPKTINMRGVERFGPRPSQELKITGRGADFDVTLEDNPLSDIFTVERIGVEETELDGEPARTITFAFIVGEEVPRGRTKNRLHFKTTDKRVPNHYVPFSVSALGDLKTDPPRINLGEMLPNREFGAIFEVSSKTRREFEIEDVIVDGALANDSTVEWTRVDPTRRDAWKVSVTGIAKNFPRQSGRITVLTNLPDERQISLSYLGWVRQQQPESGGGQ